MIKDITGIKLTPGNFGEECLGNGKHYDKKNQLIECCCDECDFYICCLDENYQEECKKCKIFYCPRFNKKASLNIFKK